MGEERRPLTCSVEYVTEWFQLVSKRIAGEGEPYYALRMPDYVSVVALTANREMVLVRQYRPAVEQYTWELPGGHVDGDEPPELAARRELAEETGFSSAQLEFLGTLFSDTGRNENRTWCYLAPAATPVSTQWSPEQGVEVSLVPVDAVHDLILGGEFGHALHMAVLMLATLRRERFLTSLLSASTGE